MFTRPVYLYFLFYTLWSTYPFIAYQLLLLTYCIVTAEPPKRLCGDAHQPVTQYAMPVGSTKRRATPLDLPILNVPIQSLQAKVHVKQQAHRLSPLPPHHRHPKLHSPASRIECLNTHQDPALVEVTATELAVLKVAEDVLRTTTESREPPMFRQLSTHQQIQRVMLKALPDLPQGRLLPQQLLNHHRVKPTPPWLLRAKIAGQL
jgi:hypothetical protein